MKKMMICMMVVLFSAVGTQAKLSDHQTMKCIDSDTPSRSAFQDLQAAYEMRLISAKDFFKVMDKPANCPQLRKDLKKLHASAVGAFPRVKSATRMETHLGAGFDVGSNGAPDSEDFSAFPPPPMPLPDTDFDDDFSDFR